MTSARLLPVSLGLFVLAGCGHQTSSPPGKGPEAMEVKLTVISQGQLLETLKAQKGKVVVLDVWADF